jgi:hypothetical protein
MKKGVSRMKNQGIDRIFIGVKDMDEAKVFFSKLFDTEFVELTGPVIKELEQRASISREAHIELLAPMHPLSENAPSYVKQMAEVLKKQKSILLGVSYRVEDADQTEAEAQKKGVRIPGVIDTADFDDALSMRNFKELVADEEDTYGIMMTFTQYDLV